MLLRIAIPVFIILAPCAPVWAQARPAPASDVFGELPEVIPPAQPRTPVEADHKAAATLYAQARLLFQRNDLAGALQRCQRAWRLAPETAAILEDIVTFAQVLERHSVAARYAVLAVERKPQSADLCARLGVLLVSQGDIPRAAGMFEHAIRLREATQRDGTLVGLYLEAGRLQLLSDQPAKAAEYFARFLEALQHPDDYQLNEKQRSTLIPQAEPVFEMIGETFLKSGRVDDARRAFELADAAKGDPQHMALRKARLELARQQPEAALQTLEPVLESAKPELGMRPFELLAQALDEQQSDKAQSQQLLQERLKVLHEKQPANMALGYYRARRMAMAGQTADAERLFTELMKGEAAMEGYRGLADIYREQRRLPELLDLLGSAVFKLESLEDLGEPFQRLAEDKEGMKALVELSLAALKAAQQEGKASGMLPAPGNLVVGARLASRLGEQDPSQLDAAHALYAAALAQPNTPQAPLMLEWGIALLTSERYAQAADVFKRMIDEKVAPDAEAGFHYYRAGALEMAGRTDEALAAAEAAIAGKPSANFHGRAAWILYHAKRFPEAEQRYREFLKTYDTQFDSEETRAAVREAKLVLSNICVLQERRDEAEEWLEQVLDEFPEDVGAANDLGYLWSERDKHLHRALRLVQYAVASEPDNEAYRDSLGWVLFRSGRKEEARRELEKAVQTEHPDGVILMHLGEVLWDLGEKDQAHDAWRRARQALQGPDHERDLQRLEESMKNHEIHEMDERKEGRE